MHLRFLDHLDHLQHHPLPVDNTETTTPRIPNSQDYLKRGILSGLGEIVMPIFEDKALVEIVKSQLAR